MKEDEITNLRAERAKVEKVKETTLQKLKQVSKGMRCTEGSKITMTTKENLRMCKPIR